ncbi:hypothetical protein [Streptomyces platensis]|uniref:hypothetical protein n=1 Tax=Streptomyces platensis TaxID=58346 RepID=UPI0033238940
MGDLRWDQAPPASFWDAALEHVAAGEDLGSALIGAGSRTGYFRLEKFLTAQGRRRQFAHPRIVVRVLTGRCGIPAPCAGCTDRTGER